MFTFYYRMYRVIFLICKMESLEAILVLSGIEKIRLRAFSEAVIYLLSIPFLYDFSSMLSPL